MKKNKISDIARKCKNRDKTKKIPFKFNYEIKVKNRKLKNKNDDKGQKKELLR